MSNFRWVMGGMGRVKGWVILAAVLMTAETLFNLSTIWLQQKVIDEVLIGGRDELFVGILVQIAFAYVAYSLLFTFGPHAIHHMVARLRSWLSTLLMNRLYRLPVGEMQKERTANYVYHFTNDLYQAADLIGSDIPRMTQQAVGAIALVWVVAQASPALLGMVVIFSLVYIMLGKKFASSRKQAQSEVSRHKSNMLVHLEEGVSSTREVLAFGRESWESKRYDSLFGKYFSSVMNEAKLINKQIVMSDPIKWLATVAVLFYGGWLVLQGQLSIGLFIVTFQFTSRLMDTLSHIYNGIMGLSGRMAAVERLRGVLEGASIHEGKVELVEPIRELKLSNLAFQYNVRSEQILSSITMDFPVGKKAALVGTSGGGKSTIASLLVRFFEPSGGHMLVNGFDLRQVSREDWAKKVTVVFQEPYLFPETIRTNLMLGFMDVTEADMVEVCRAMRIHDFIESQPDGYDTVIGERGITLSGGQRQRLALARAMLRNPEVLILDEATSSLDLETEREIQQELDKRRLGRTTIIIAHRLSTIRNADVIYVLDKGHVAEFGTHEELMSKQAVYRTLLQKQNADDMELGA